MLYRGCRSAEEKSQTLAECRDFWPHAFSDLVQISSVILCCDLQPVQIYQNIREECIYHREETQNSMAKKQEI